MQLTYEYSASLVFMNGENKKEIPQNNIKTIIINKEFDRLTMPTINMTLEMDRELADEVIKNKKTATMFLKMNKIQTSNVSNAVEETYFYDEFTYLIEEDFDKTKPFRYIDPDKKDQKSTEADKYRPIRLGLISKTCSDLARKPNNLVTYDSSMQDIVIKLLNISKPLLIEPFEYTDPVPQCVIPPKETLTKVLEYLNNIKVFYSTGYRFFMDLDVMYLVSKAGKYIPKQNEKTGVVNIEVKTLDKNDSLARGISLADDNSAYNLIIEATNSNLDNSDLTDKEIDSITAVVDGSKAKQESFLKQHKGFGGILGTYTNIMNTIDNVTKMASQVRKTIKNIHKATYDIKARINELKDVATEFETTTQSIITTAQATLKNMPKEALEQFSKEHKDAIQGIIKNAKDTSKTYNKSIVPSPDKMQNFTDKYVGQIYNIENTKNLVGGIKPSLFADNVSALKTTTNNFEKDKKETSKAFDDSLVSLATDYSKYNSSLDSLKQGIGNLPDQFEYTVSVGSGDSASTETRTVDLSQLTKYSKTVDEAHKDSTIKLGSLKEDKKHMQDSVTVNKNVGDSIKSYVENAKDLPKDFKKKLLEGGNNVVNSYNNLRDNAIKNYNDTAAALNNDFNSLTDSFNAIKDSAALSVDSLHDLSNIGSDGESMVNIALEATEILSDLSKRKIIRLPNDNINILKNIKHSLELRRVKVKLHKQELDNSIFAINKKYTITFEGTDNFKYQGEYLLESVIEAYTNSGTQFQSNTILNFAKLPGSKSEIKPGKIEPNKDKKNKNSIGTISAGGIKVDIPILH